MDVGGAGGGIGVKVFVPEPTAVETQLNAHVTLHTYLQVREDALNLYGFATEDELSMFELLARRQRRRSQGRPRNPEHA